MPRVKVRVSVVRDQTQRHALQYARRVERGQSAMRGAEKVLAKTAYVGDILRRRKKFGEPIKFTARETRKSLR